MLAISTIDEERNQCLLSKSYFICFLHRSLHKSMNMLLSSFPSKESADSDRLPKVPQQVAEI